MKTNFQSLIAGVNGKNLEKLLKVHLERISSAVDKSEKVQKALEDYIDFSKKNLQKVGFKRYNPFQETGGNQSFILALLDQNNNGVILTSLHQRQLTRVYAKQINKGECENKLSEEESEVLDSVIKV